MKVDLSEKVVSAVKLFQENPDFLDNISVAEDFIIDNCAEPEWAAEALNNIQGLRLVRKILKNIIYNEQD